MPGLFRDAQKSLPQEAAGIFSFSAFLVKGGYHLAKEMKAETGDRLILSEQEKKVIAVLRGIEFGEVKIALQDGIPVRIEETKKSKI